MMGRGTLVERGGASVGTVLVQGLNLGEGDAHPLALEPVGVVSLAIHVIRGGCWSRACIIYNYVIRVKKVNLSTDL